MQAGTKPLIEIPLHSRKYSGMVALIDDDDYEMVSAYRWHPIKGRSNTNTFYAHAPVKIDGKFTSISMHKLISGYAMTDHEDHNGLNNQRYNLRDVNTTQNSCNQRKMTTRKTSSRFKGVSLARSGKWCAMIGIDYKRICLGTFADERDAAIAYNVAASEHFGEFACLNVVLASEKDFYCHLALISQLASSCNGYQQLAAVLQR
jgi:hypothetical protein